MINLFKYHSNPQTLSAYEDRTKFIPELAYRHAMDMLNGKRWKEGEPAIMKDPFFAYIYAREVIKDRWKEAEPAIMKEPVYTFWYARDVIKDRWKEAEPFIQTARIWWNDYKQHFNIKD